jgi:hypothetical protein
MLPPGVHFLSYQVRRLQCVQREQAAVLSQLWCPQPRRQAHRSPRTQQQARSRRDGTLSPPVSTLLQLSARGVVVRRWDAAAEGLLEVEEDEVRAGGL